MSSHVEQARPLARDRHRASENRPRMLSYAGIGVIAFVVRLAPLLIGAGLGGYGRYDDGVYYAAADAVTYGRVPYRDFVLLHPPGIALILAPFALLGHVTSDHMGFAVARIVFMLVGAANAILVAAVAQRWSRWAALAAGLFYACWLPAVYSEQSTLLEPLGTMGTLIALLLLLRAPHPTRRRDELLAGAVLGLTLTLKIWALAPFSMLAVYLLATRGWTASMRLVASGAAAAAVVLAPFFALAPSRMFDMVIRDQLQRPAGALSPGRRLASILGTHTTLPAHAIGPTAAAVTVSIVVIVGAVGCLRDRTAWPLVVVAATDLAVLLRGPSYFGHYAELTAAPLVLVVAVGLGRLPLLGQRRQVAVAVLGVSLAVTVYSGYQVAGRAQGRPLAGPLLARAAPPGCIASDSPEMLIQMNRLSADLATGCALPVDVGGLGYDLRERVGTSMVYLPRSRNPAWQEFLYSYLIRSRAFVLLRGEGELGRKFYRALVARPELAVSDGVVLRAGDSAGP
jgi:alpha-1,2-mannosyltransferase